MKNSFYVYIHRHPISYEVVYVGKGVNGRAWDVTRSRAGNDGHMEWMLRLGEQGFIPSDWVVILYKCLDETSAFQKERDYLQDHGPLPFNRQCGERQHQSKLTDDQAKDVFRLAWDGELSRSDISSAFNISPSNVSMIKHKKQWKTVLREETHENYENSLQRTNSGS